jgi:hypothetical protein
MAASTPSRRDRHLDQARRNYALYQRLTAGEQDLDWAVTALFYTAVHLLQAFAAGNGLPLLPGHREREGFLSTHCWAALGPYLKLYRASNETRYKLRYPTLSQVLNYHDEHFRAFQTLLAEQGTEL